MIKNLNEVPISDIDQYQILVLKNLIDDKYKDKLEQVDAQIESEIDKHTELNKQLKSAHLLEELSRKNMEGQDENSYNDLDQNKSFVTDMAPSVGPMSMFDMKRERSGSRGSHRNRSGNAKQVMSMSVVDRP